MDADEFAGLVDRVSTILLASRPGAVDRVIDILRAVDSLTAARLALTMALDDDIPIYQMVALSDRLSVTMEAKNGQ